MTRLSDKSNKPSIQCNEGSDDELFSRLPLLEIAWRDRQLFLQSRGYMLRPRLRPGWVPSWRSGKKDVIGSEDHVGLLYRLNSVDATRVDDGAMVCIKRVKTGGKESQILLLLNEGGVRDDPRNHAVPILDHFQDDVDPAILYVVMPFLRPLDCPPPQTVGDCIDMVTQYLEELVLMHEMGVAHRYNVRYYYVDFGTSSSFPPCTTSRLVTGTHGRNQNAPELSSTVPYDAFKVDVFSMGQMFEELFLTTYSNTQFLTPLVDLMTIPVPSDRLTAAEALEKWEGTVKPSPYGRALRLNRREYPFDVILEFFDCLWAVPSLFA